MLKLIIMLVKTIQLKKQVSYWIIMLQPKLMIVLVKIILNKKFNKTIKMKVYKAKTAKSKMKIKI